MKYSDIINNRNLILLSVGLIFIATLKFMSGFHNLDLSYNMNTINGETYNNNYKDMGSDGVIRTDFELHILGLDQILTSFILLFGSAIMFGICLGGYSR